MYHALSSWSIYGRVTPASFDSCCVHSTVTAVTFTFPTCAFVLLKSFLHAGVCIIYMLLIDALTTVGIRLKTRWCGLACHVHITAASRYHRHALIDGMHYITIAQVLLSKDVSIHPTSYTAFRRADFEISSSPAGSGPSAKSNVPQASLKLDCRPSIVSRVSRNAICKAAPPIRA